MSTIQPLEERPYIQDCINAVMAELGIIPKGDRNAQQGFNFRGVDAVINNVSPLFVKHRIYPKPFVEDLQSENVQTRSGGTMRNVVVRVRFVFKGPRGDTEEVVTYGEAADSGDKAVSKAQSVAYRVALSQLLCIPTGQPDPDSQSYERAAPPAQQASAAPPPEPSGRNWLTEVGQMSTVDQVQALWRECSAFGELTDEVRTAMTAQASKLGQQADAAKKASKTTVQTNDGDREPAGV